MEANEMLLSGTRMVLLRLSWASGSVGSFTQKSTLVEFLLCVQGSGG